MSDIREVIAHIRSGGCSSTELIGWLKDPRLLVAANAIVALALHESGDQATDDLVALALSARGTAKLLGTVTLKHLCAAALIRLNTRRSQAGLNTVAANMSPEDEETLDWLQQNLPLSF